MQLIKKQFAVLLLLSILSNQHALGQGDASLGIGPNISSNVSDDALGIGFRLLLFPRSRATLNPEISYYSPAFVVGSLTAYLVSQTFDVWFFNKIKSITGESKLWLRINLSTITSQLIDTLIYQFTWVFATGMDWSTALMLALTKYVFKVLIAAIDTIFIYWVKKW